jgi:hypothetical protein
MKGDVLHPKPLQDGDKIPCHGFPSLLLNLCITIIVFVCFLFLFHATILVFLSSISPSVKLVIHVEPNSIDMHKVLLWNHGIVIILIIYGNCALLNKVMESHI